MPRLATENGEKRGPGKTDLAFLEDNLTVLGTHGVIVETDTTVLISPNGNLFFINRIRGNDLVWVEPFHEAQGSEFAHFTGIHGISKFGR